MAAMMIYFIVYVIWMGVFSDRKNAHGDESYAPRPAGEE
jgi:hypothetical protein